jgi:hypothetical protein
LRGEDEHRLRGLLDRNNPTEWSDLQELGGCRRCVDGQTFKGQ